MYGNVAVFQSLDASFTFQLHATSTELVSYFKLKFTVLNIDQHCIICAAIYYDMTTKLYHVHLLMSCITLYSKCILRSCNLEIISSL